MGRIEATSTALPSVSVTVALFTMEPSTLLRRISDIHSEAWLCSIMCCISCSGELPEAWAADGTASR